MTNKPTPENSVELFCKAVEAAGLRWSVSIFRWRIMGGTKHRVVCCLLHGTAGCGFRYRADVQPHYVTGTVAAALELAGPPKQEPGFVMQENLCKPVFIRCWAQTNRPTSAETVDRPVGPGQSTARRWIRKLLWGKAW